MESLEAALARGLRETVIRDRLWACVICGQEAGIRAQGRVEQCVACNAVYKRGRGAAIAVSQDGRAAVVRNPAEWVRELPAPSSSGEALAYVKTARTDKSLWYRGRFFGRIEKFSTIVRGRLSLSEQRLTFVADGEAGGFDWALEELTAVQPSSSALQVKARGHPVVSIKFPDSSPRLWEERLQRAVRGCYTRLGRGDILEFQPRICTC